MKGVWRGIGLSGFIAVVACIALVACSGGGSSSGGSTPSVQTGSVSGVVVSAETGNAPVAGAFVSTTAGSTASGADGSFTVPAPVNDRAVIHVEASGFAEAFPVARVVSGQTTTVGVKLLPVGSTQPVTVASGGTVTVPNSTAQVDLPANGLVPQNGGTVAGTVNVSVTPINPAVDPKLMPGDFTGLSAGGTTPIESFGAIVVDIRDNAGNRYNLAAGKTATIRIPLGTKSSNPPTTIPLWYFDETSGLWKEEGTATLQGTAPNQYYEGTVSHFSTWNADDPMLRTWVNGCVQDANGQRVAYAWVESDGIDYSGGDSDWTMADGTFKVGVRKGGSSAVRVVKYNSNPFSFEVISNSVTVTSSPNDPTDFVRTLQNCLVVNPGVLTVATSVLAGGNVNAVYNQTLAATGGVPGYAWSLNAGSNPLPAGLSLNASGVILGTPTAAGTTTITVKVTDSVGGIATKQLSITISPAGVMPISITTASPLPAGVVGSTYNLSLAATGGTGTRTWSVTAGSLPTGLTLNPSTGAISGIPTTQGTATFTVQVADSGNPQQSDQRQLSLTINSVGGGGGGTLTVTGAPASVGGSFVVNPSDIVIEDFFGFRGVVWGEVVSGGHIEGVGVVYELSTGNLVSSSFFISDGGVYKQWSCFTPLGSPLPGWTPCSGVTLDVSTGTVTFANATLGDIENLVPTITLNGSLSVTP